MEYDGSITPFTPRSQSSASTPIASASSAILVKGAAGMGPPKRGRAIGVSVRARHVTAVIPIVVAEP